MPRLIHTCTTTRQAVVAWVCITTERQALLHDRDALAQELRAWVATRIGPIARPRDVFIVDELPKTRSGKIVRRLLKAVTEGQPVGDTTTLADTSLLAALQEQIAKKR